QWVWHVGLDAEASGLLNDLYNRVEVDDERMGRLLCLFELTFADPAAMRPAIAGRPVYLAMAMDGDRRLMLKPQNLLLNLPLARSGQPARVSRTSDAATRHAHDRRKSHRGVGQDDRLRVPAPRTAGRWPLLRQRCDGPGAEGNGLQAGRSRQRPGRRDLHVRQ